MEASMVGLVAPGRLRQEDHCKFQPGLGCIMCSSYRVVQNDILKFLF